MKKSNKKNITVIDSFPNLVPAERKGTFEQGFDKLGRPYRQYNRIGYSCVTFTSGNFQME